MNIPICFGRQKAVVFCRNIAIILVIFFVTGALSQGTTTFKTPDVLSISYIKGGNGLTDCIPQLRSKLLKTSCQLDPETCGKIDQACDLLVGTANDDPPDSFSNMNYYGGDFASWVVKKEYRGYIHIPSFDVSCDASGHLIKFDPRDPDYLDQHNPTQHPDKVTDDSRNPYGYTKVWPFYQSADIYTKDLSYNGIRYAKNSDNTCFGIHDARSSRVASLERAYQHVLLGYDAPFIYGNIDMSVCCNRQVSVAFSCAVFPEARLYINGKKVGEQTQGSLGDFIVSGGKTNNKDGVGNFAPPGSGINWIGKIKKNSKFRPTTFIVIALNIRRNYDIGPWFHGHL
ncbi:13131_t:CDS:2, partial [Dentiscutata heterogama]